VISFLKEVTDLEFEFAHVEELPPAFRRIVKRKNGMDVKKQKKIFRRISRDKLIQKIAEIQEVLHKLYGNEIPNHAIVRTRDLKKTPIVTRILMEYNIITRYARYTYIVDFNRLKRLNDRIKDVNEKMIHVKVLKEV